MGQAVKEKHENRRTLWKATLGVPGSRKDIYFLFRETNDVSIAIKTAQELLEASAGADMVGAQINAIEAVDKLWN